MDKTDFSQLARTYLQRLDRCFTDRIIELVKQFSDDLYQAWSSKKQVFICGNGGSAANAIHITNDFHYGVGACGSTPQISGLKVEALTANSAVLTCLGNDIGYENIFSQQLEVKANPGDLLIVLSGSGNSPNIIQALKTAKSLGMKSYAILAFNGGHSLKLADVPIHFPVDDMQIAEDTQLIIGHMCMQWLSINKPQK